jgi:DNA-binding transcriptional ArsR family regulator
MVFACSGATCCSIIQGSCRADPRLHGQPVRGTEAVGQGRRRAARRLDGRGAESPPAAAYLEANTRELGLFGIKQSTFTSLLDPLEKAGLVRRGDQSRRPTVV